MKQGFTKVRIDGELSEINQWYGQVSRYNIHDIELVVDRCQVMLGQEHRISESTELALHKSEGTMMPLIERGDDEWDEKLYSIAYSCPSCGRSYEQLAPNMFSFNSPYGACKHCEGLGELKDFNTRLVIPDRTISVADGGILPLGKLKDSWLVHRLMLLQDNLKWI